MNTASAAFRVVAGLVLAAAVAFVIWWVFVRPAADQRAAVQSGVAAAAATTGATNAKDANATAAQVVVLHDHSDTVTHENTTKILAAPGASDAVPPAVDAAWLDALCLRTAYIGNPACAGLPHAAAVDSDGSDAGGSNSR